MKTITPAADLTARQCRLGAVLGAALLCASLGASARAQGWESTVNPYSPGSFPEPRPLHAKYNFGWNGFTAATADVRVSKTSAGQIQFDATGGTSGVARSLWKYDVKHSALSDAHTLRPIEVTEVETLRKKEVTTKVAYTPERVSSGRDERRGSAVSSKTRSFDFSNLFSLDSALLYVRSQPLTDGAVQRIVIYPSTSAYLATISVRGRERITVPAGTYDAFKIDLQLSKIGKKRELLPHKKFHRATIWLSNDPDRLILRIEADVFVGTVFAELESMQFDTAKQ